MQLTLDHGDLTDIIKQHCERHGFIVHDQPDPLGSNKKYAVLFKKTPDGILAIIDVEKVEQ